MFVSLKCAPACRFGHAADSCLRSAIAQQTEGECCNLLNIPVLCLAAGFLNHEQRTIRDLQETNEALTLQRNSTRCQLTGVQTQITKAEDTQLRLRQQVAVLSTSLTQAEEEARKAEALASNLAHQRAVSSVFMAARFVARAGRSPV